MNAQIEPQMLFVGEEDKTTSCAGIQTELHEGECAVHIKSYYDAIPFASLYLGPIEAALLGSALIQSAKEAVEDE